MRPCPFCKCVNVTMVYDTINYYVKCDGCGARGPIAQWQWQAAQYWDCDMKPPIVMCPMEYME